MTTRHHRAAVNQQQRLRQLAEYDEAWAGALVYHLEEHRGIDLTALGQPIAILWRCPGLYVSVDGSSFELLGVGPAQARRIVTMICRSVKPTRSFPDPPAVADVLKAVLGVVSLGIGVVGEVRDLVE